MNRIINLEVTNRTVPVRFDVVQYATEPAITFHVTDWEVSGSAQLYIEKPSGAKIYNQCTIDGQDIIYKPTTQSFAEKGVNKCQLRVVTSTGDLVSFLIFANVTENIIDDSAVESQDEFTALVEALETVSSYDSRITAVESGLSTAQNDISTAQNDISTAQSDISTLQGDVQGAQGDISSIISDFYYQPGETGTLSGFVGNGYSTATSGVYYFYLTPPKKIPQNETLTATSCITSIRGPGGRATSNADNLANLGSITVNANGQLVLAFNSITTNFTANAPANIVLHTLTFTISDSSTNAE